MCPRCTPTIRRLTASLTQAIFESCEEFLGRKVRQDDVEPLTWAVAQFGNQFTASQHAADLEKLRLIGREIVLGLNDVDVLLTPTLPTLPKPLGHFDMSLSDVAEYDRRAVPNSIFTRPFNISGQPALNLPLHVASDNVRSASTSSGGVETRRRCSSSGTSLKACRPGWTACAKGHSACDHQGISFDL